MTNSEDSRGTGRQGRKGRRQRSAIRAQFEDEHEVLGVLTGQVHRLTSDEMPLHSHDPEKDGMTNSENPYEEIVAKPPIRPGEVLGVLTGQVPVRSMPIATGHTCHSATRCKVCAEDKPLDSDGD